MQVKDWMTEGSQNLGTETLVLDAAEIMRRRGIRQLPVIDDDGKLVGIVSDRDIRDAMPSKYLPGDAVTQQGSGLMELKVKDIMSVDPATISPDAPVESAALQLQSMKIGGLPVINPSGELVGIITEVDVYKYLCAVTGFSQEGIQLVFKIEDTPGAAIELLSFLKDQDIRLVSVLTSYENVEFGYRHVSIRIQSAGKHTQDSLMELLQDKFTLLSAMKAGQVADAL